MPVARVRLACSTFLILLSSSAVPQEPARAGADAGLGQLIFNNACRTCHTTKEGDNRLGPNLHNIIGRKAGSLPNFGYSSAMKGVPLEAAAPPPLPPPAEQLVSRRDVRKKRGASAPLFLSDHHRAAAAPGANLIADGPRAT
jgi:hypothetical protein